MGNVENLSLGPGTLFVAEVGSEEPVDLTAPWDAAWTPIGYTDEGTEFAAELTRDPVNVAESIDPIMYATTSRSFTVSFAMAEMTARNLSLALNGGTVTSGTGVVTFDPPEAGTEKSVALGWESSDGTERWIFRKTSQSGSVSIGQPQGQRQGHYPGDHERRKRAGRNPLHRHHGHCPGWRRRLMATRKVVDSFTVERDEDRGVLGTFTAFGQEWTIIKKPPPLLLAEMGRTQTASPESIGVVVDFFEVILGKEQYQTAFRWAFFDAYNGDDELLGEVMGAALEAALGRPLE